MILRCLSFSVGFFVVCLWPYFSLSCFLPILCSLFLTLLHYVLEHVPYSLFLHFPPFSCVYGFPLIIPLMAESFLLLNMIPYIHNHEDRSFLGNVFNKIVCKLFNFPQTELHFRRVQNPHPQT